MTGRPPTGESQLSQAQFFDSVATDYTPDVRSVPDPYVELICSILDVRRGSRVLELGCGAGTLAISLAARGADVTAVDVSHKMITMAREAIGSEKVRWINVAAEKLAYEQDHYDAIISYESFHLFSGGTRLLRRIHQSLRVGGGLGVGWYEAEWESVCREHIASVFSKFGSSMADWGYWTCPKFEQEVAASTLDWTPVKSVLVSVSAHTPVTDVVKFLSSIERASRIPDAHSKRFFDGLHSSLSELTAGSGLFSGEAKYALKWVRKQTNARDGAGEKTTFQL